MARTKRRKIHPAIVKIHHALKDHFIPHEGNGYHPHVLQHHVLFGYTVFLVLLKVVALVASIALPSAIVFSSAITEPNILDLTNVSRASQGLAPLESNAQLAVSAEHKAQDMLANHYFAHNSPTGKSPWDWIMSAGYVYEDAGENLAVHYTTAESVEDGWMQSPGHRANILNKTYTQVGIGIARGQFEGAETTFVVQHFGRPRTIASTRTVIPSTSAPTSTPIVPENKPTVAAAEKSAIVVSPTKTSPTIHPETAKLTPTHQSVQVAVHVDKAQTVTVQAGSDVSPMTETASGTWTGSVTLPEPSTSPDATALPVENPIIVTAVASSGLATAEPLATVTAGANTKDIFAGPTAPQSSIKILGVIPINGLQDNVKQFYVIFMILLMAGLLVNIFAKIEIQHHSVNAHILFVILLSGILAIV